MSWHQNQPALVTYTTNTTTTTLWVWVTGQAIIIYTYTPQSSQKRPISTPNPYIHIDKSILASAPPSKSTHPHTPLSTTTLAAATMQHLKIPTKMNQIIILYKDQHTPWQWPFRPPPVTDRCVQPIKVRLLYIIHPGWSLKVTERWWQLPRRQGHTSTDPNKGGPPPPPSHLTLGWLSLVCWSSQLNSQRFSYSLTRYFHKADLFFELYQ